MQFKISDMLTVPSVFELIKKYLTVKISEIEITIRLIRLFIRRLNILRLEL